MQQDVPVPQIGSMDSKLPLSPQLSICIPAYNRPEGLRTALQSIVAALPSSHAALVEVIISDDSTTAAPAAEVEAVLRDWPGRWHYHKNQHRLGMVANWNQSVGYARGEFVLLLHDDDFLVPHGGMQILKTLAVRGGHHDVFLFGVELVNGQGQRLRRQVPSQCTWLPPQIAVQHLLRHSSFVRFPGLVWRRSLLGRVGSFSSAYGEATDVYQWLHFFAIAGVYTVPVVTAAYTIHDHALSMGMFQPSTLGYLNAIFREAEQLHLLPAKVVRHAQRDFLHQFILAGTWRFLRRRRWSQAVQVYDLFREPLVQQGGRSPRWAVLRCLFGLVVGLLRRVSFPLGQDQKR